MSNTFVTRENTTQKRRSSAMEIQRKKEFNASNMVRTSTTNHLCLSGLPIIGQGGNGG